MRYISIGSRYIFLNPYLISVYQLEEFHHSYGKLLYNQGQLAVVLLLSIVGFLRFHEIPGARLRLWEGFPPKKLGKRVMFRKWHFCGISIIFRHNYIFGVCMSMYLMMFVDDRYLI